jgi:hypothetical protein
LAGLRYIQDEGRGTFLQIYTSCHKAWLAHIIAVPQLVDGTVSLTSFRTQIYLIVREVSEYLSLHIQYITQAELITQAESSHSTVLVFLRGAFAAADLDSWLDDVCTSSRRTGARCGDNIVDCGEQCDSNSDTCYNCILVEDCDASNSCSIEGTVGNFVPAVETLSPEGTSTIDTPSLSVQKPIDVVYSSDSSYALFLDFDGKLFFYKYVLD